MQEQQENLLTICPCGKSNNCFNSKTIDFAQCFDCGLTKMPKETDFENMPKLYKDFLIGNWQPYYLLTDFFTVYLDGTSKENAKYIFVKFDVNGKPVQSTRKEFEMKDFFNLLNFLNNAND